MCEYKYLKYSEGKELQIQTVNQAALSNDNEIK